MAHTSTRCPSGRRELGTSRPDRLVSRSSLESEGPPHRSTWGALGEASPQGLGSVQEDFPEKGSSELRLKNS